MSMAGQSESGDIFVAGVKAKELEIIGSSVLLSYSNGKIKLMISSPLLLLLLAYK